MKQAIMDKPGEIRFEDTVAVAPGPGEVQLRVRQIGICGSDIHVWHGSHPFTPYPVIQGHEFMGTVEAVGPDVQNAPAIGAKVYAWVRDGNVVYRGQAAAEQVVIVHQEDADRRVHGQAIGRRDGNAQSLTIPSRHRLRQGARLLGRGNGGVEILFIGLF